MSKRQQTVEIKHPEAQKILEKAKERGLESNFLFSTTFERYLAQLDSLETIKKAQERDFATGNFDLRLTRLYNSTVAGANGTATTLVAIIKKLGTEEPQDNKLRNFMDNFKDDDD